MKKSSKPILFLAPLIISLALYGCAQNIKITKFFEAQYTEIISLTPKNNSAEIYNIISDKLDKVGTIPNVSDIIYNFNNNVYVYLITIPGGVNLQHNNIKIEDKNGNRQITSSYSSQNLKISNDGSKLAYRSFNKDSYDGAEGIKLYDISLNKEINFKTQVFVSGSLYQWLTNKEFIYYGVEEKKRDYKIYKYNLDTNKEDIYLDNINGYLTFFYPINDSGIVYKQENIDESSLMYKNIKTNEVKLLSNSIGNISNAIFDNASDCLYFIGLEKNENKTLLFKLSLKDMALTRLNYDYPYEIDKDGGLALGSNHNLYFCGLVKGDEKNNNQIYTYNTIDRSITLITNQANKYYLGGNNK